MNTSISSLKAKKVSTLSHDSAIRLLHGTRRPHIQHQFPKKKIDSGNDYIHEME
jgi:hypothetical protein